MERQSVTKLEMLLAVGMSEFQRKSHVHFLPAGKHYTDMLLKMRSSACIEPTGPLYFKLTKKGRNYIRKNQISKFRELDKEIDAYVDAL